MVERLFSFISAWSRLAPSICGGIVREITVVKDAQEIEKTRKELYFIIAGHSGQSFDNVFQDADRDYWMTSKSSLS